MDDTFDYASYDAASDDEIAAAMYEAMKIKPECINFDAGKRDAYMKGSRIPWYHVTLSSCECRSFFYSDKRFPCKHMFRLAYELGYRFRFPEFDPNAGYDPTSDLELLHQRWVSGRITYDAYKACKAALEKSVRTAKRARRRK